MVDPRIMLTKEALVDALNEFGDIHDREIKPRTAEVYWKYLKEAPQMDANGFRFAVKWLMENHRWFPTPSDFCMAERRRWT